MVSDKEPENTGDYMVDQTNNICNKIQLFGHGITDLYSKNKRLEERIAQVEKTLEKKIDIEVFEESQEALNESLLKNVREFPGVLYVLRLLDRGEGYEAECEGGLD